jgi:hypothetical protein
VIASVRIHPLCVAAAVLVPAAARAQVATPPAPPAPAAATAPTTLALPGPPVRRIATASALSTEPLGSIVSVRELPDGRVLLNDGTRRRLLLMDTTLRTTAVVLDSLTEVANTYGTRQGTLIPYRGDSTAFVDPASLAVIVLDAAGQVTRVRSVWRVQDLPWLSGGFYGWPATDARGRIVYRVPARPAPPAVAPPRDVPYFPPEPDSAFIVAIDPDSRKLDTLAAIRIPKQVMNVRANPQGGFNFTPTINPMPSTDEWAVLADGTLAVVRALDYRVEYLDTRAGTWTSGPKLPYPWQRMTDDDKQRLLDSVRTAQQRSQLTSFVSSMIRWANQYRKPYPPGFTIPADYRIPNGLSRGWVLPAGATFPANYIYACAPGEEPTMRPAPGAAPGAAATPPATAPPAGAPPAGVTPPGPPSGTPSCIPGPVMQTGGQAPPPPTMREVAVVRPSELPDYRPPITSGAVRADADGNLWIRPVPPTPTPGGAVYDVVSREGKLVDRLQLPPGYSLVGFGRGRVVYLSMRDASGIHLARVRLQ